MIDLPRVALQTLSPVALADAIDAGPLASSESLTLTLTLAPTDARQAALTQFLTDLQTAASPNYRKWITPSQFAASYGATPEQLAAASAWAQKAGLDVKVISVSASRMTLTGYPAQVEAAFAVSLHQYRLNGHLYYANATQPSLPSDVAALVTSIEGLDDLPGNEEPLSKGPNATPEALDSGIPPPPSISMLGSIIDESGEPILTLGAIDGLAALTPSRVAAYEALFRQAAAQGITILSSTEASSASLIIGSPEIIVVAAPGANRGLQTSAFPRPPWQTAPGLPGDNLRHAPDLTAISMPGLTSTLASIAQKLPSGRLGNINPVLYQLAPTPGLYTQMEFAPAGSWQPQTGLGLINLDELAKAFPLGVGSSFTSFAASNYAPTHGQSVTITSNVTSGTGGSVPTGTVAFVTSAGVTLATSPLVAGTATYSTNQLPGGSNTLQAKYSGDGTYAASSSPATVISVDPEASQLAAKVSTGNSFGVPYTVSVTDTASSGVGSPTGTITLIIEGPNTTYTQPLLQSPGNSSSATFSIPATTVGTQTLLITCTGTANYSCDNPLTTTVTIARATPTLSISYSPDPPISGNSITLNAAVSGLAGAAVPTGSVTFFDNKTTLNSANLVNGNVTETGTVPTTATHTITATYNGDADYNPASSSGSTGGGSGAATLAATLSSTSGAPGFTITVATTVTLPGATSAPSGTVQATLTLPTGPSFAVGTLSPAGTNAASSSIPVILPLTPGSYQLTISCPSTDAFTCNSVPFTITVAPTTKIATTTTLSAMPAHPQIGQTVTLSAVVTSATTAEAPISGAVLFYQGSTQIGSGTLANGVATATFTFAGPSLGTITATYSGDTNYATSTSAPLTFTSTLTPVSVVLAVTSGAGTAGSAVTLIATVSGPASPATSPTGSVNYYLAGAAPTLLGTATLTPTTPGSATASLTTANLPAGAQAVYAVYSGDTVYATGTSSSISIGLTDYSVIFTPQTLTLSPGQTGSVMLKLNAIGGFNDKSGAALHVADQHEAHVLAQSVDAHRRRYQRAHPVYHRVYGHEPECTLSQERTWS